MYYDTIYEFSLFGRWFDLYYKALKISGEYILFIVFEVWKLWLAFDGVLHSNSRTVWASASFSIFSFVFNIPMITESVKWVQLNEWSSAEELSEFDPSRFEVFDQTSQKLCIALSCISFLFIPATFYSAVKVGKDFGWDVYKKIGGSIKIQDMYIIVQWFSLALKIDIYFEYCAYALYLFYLMALKRSLRPIFFEEYIFIIMFSIVATILIATIPSLILSRFAIARESKILMILFILFQLLYIASILFIAIMMRELLTEWYAFAGFCLASLISSTGTIVLAIMCLLNFGKGLKEFVQWKPFSKKILRIKAATYNNMNQIATPDGLEDQRVDEPIDD